MLLQASIYIVFALLLIVSALLLLVVLMQRPKQEGLGAAFGAQMTDQAFGAQTTDVLKKGTVFFGTLFMLFAFILAVLMNAQYRLTHTTTLSDAPAVEKPVAEQPATEEEALPAEEPVEPAEDPSIPAAPAEDAAPAVEQPAESPADSAS